MQIVPVTTQKDIEHELLARQIAEQAEVLARLREELAPLERAFTAFEQRVAHQSAAKTAERDRLRHLCDEIERYTARLHARLEADPDGLMSAVFTPEELRYIGDLFGIEVPEDWFDMELHATTETQDWDCSEEFGRNGHPPEKAPEPETSDLRSLYRQMARTFHPDLTTDPGERHFRQEMMLRINHAWELRDFQTMQAIRDDVRDLLAGAGESVEAYRLAWQRRELAQLVDSCAQCTSRITALRTSKTISLWHNATLANAAIARHIGRLDQDIDRLLSRKVSVIEEFRLALGAYSAHRM